MQGRLAASGLFEDWVFFTNFGRDLRRRAWKELPAVQPQAPSDAVLIISESALGSGTAVKALVNLCPQAGEDIKPEARRFSPPPTPTPTGNRPPEAFSEA
uniref:Uncharacterized protein n=1 Tax=Rhizochromulina marina TaxID=1034831 RepID=A0A7S2WKD0_9STRA|mmetsp:Transcript_27261/g.79445  ORF Transcript_27261/g.79445 Transcript_27261/m.79445 type:complete len:100 (+) Transcript_27261:581-880(+)